MSDCLDDDSLVSVGNAVEWDTGYLRHIGTCASCQNRLRQFGEFRGILAAELNPGADFASRVVEQLPEGAIARSAPAFISVNLVAIPLVAGLTGGFAAAFAVQGSDGIDTGLAMLVAGIAAMVVTLGWNARQQLSGRVVP